MEAEAIEAAKAAAELNIMGGLASVTGVQSPAAETDGRDRFDCASDCTA